MNDTPSKWKILEEHIYESFSIFEIRRSKRLNPRTQKPFDFFLMRGLDWCNVIAFTPKFEVILVRQFRHGCENFTLELPGGCVERGEDPLASVMRELREETGYVPQRTELLGSIHPNPAMQAMRCHCFVAFDCTPQGAQTLDAGEDIEVQTIALTQVLEMISKEGSISHALVVAAFGLFALRYPELVRG